MFVIRLNNNKKKKKINFFSSLLNIYFILVLMFCFRNNLVLFDHCKKNIINYQRRLVEYIYINDMSNTL